MTHQNRLMMWRAWMIKDLGMPETMTDDEMRANLMSRMGHTNYNEDLNDAFYGESGPVKKSGYTAQPITKTMEDGDFLQWIHDRLKNVHKEEENVDYMIRLRNIIELVKGGLPTDDDADALNSLNQLTIKAHMEGITSILKRKGKLKSHVMMLVDPPQTLVADLNERFGEPEMEGSTPPKGVDSPNIDPKWLKENAEEPDELISVGGLASKFRPSEIDDLEQIANDIGGPLGALLKEAVSQEKARAAGEMPDHLIWTDENEKTWQGIQASHFMPLPLAPAQKMISDGLIKQNTRDGLHFYTLTDEGMILRAEWLESR